MKLGERIKIHRKAINMTQAELGRLLGVQNSAVCKWEKGRVDNLTIAQIKKMAEIFGVSPVYLAGWDEE